MCASFLLRKYILFFLKKCFKMFQLAILPNLAFDDERRRNLAEDDYRREILKR